MNQATKYKVRCYLVPPSVLMGEMMLGCDAVLQRQLQHKRTCLPPGPRPEPQGQRLPPSLPVLFRFLKDAKESQRCPAEIQRKSPEAAELIATFLTGEKKQVKLMSRT